MFDYCLFVFILCLVYPLLPVSVWLLFVCLHPVSCVPTVASFCVIIVCLSSSCVLCTHCCQFLCDYCLFVFILCLVYPLLPVSVWLLFVCLHPVSCVPTVASFCVIIVCLSSSCVLCTHCCQFLCDYCLFVFILCLVYPLLPVSVWLLFVCLHPVSCVPTVASFCVIIVCLSSSCVLCTHCCQFLCDYCLFVFILCLVYPLLPVSVWLLFVCLHPVSCVPTVASFCVIIVCLSSSCVLCTHCCQFLCDYCLFVFILCLVYPLLPVSVWLLFVCLHPVSCVPTVASFCVIIVCLSSSCVLCTHCCQFLCDYCLFVFILCLVYPLLPVSVWLLFVCLHPVSCVPTVASFCVIIVCLSSSCVLCTHCCQFLCDYCLFVFILCLVYPLLPVSVWLLFVCLHPVSCVPTVASFCVIIVCLSSSCVLCTHCCQFLCDYCLFVFILCLVYPLLPVSVWLLFVCLHPVSCVPTVASFCVIIVCLSSSCVLCTHCCQFLCDYCLFVFILCLVYPLLPVSVWLLFVCLHPVSCVPTVASFCVIIVCLSSSCVLCTHCCQFLCDYCLFVFILCLVYPLLPVSVWLLFVCLHPVSCVPTVASFCVIIVCLSSSCVLCTHCCQFLCDYCLFVFILCLVYPLLPVSVWLLFVCLHPVSCVPTVASFCVIIVCLSSSCVLCTHCCQFLCDYCLFVFILCLVYPLLPVSVWLLFVCLHPVSCVPTVASFCFIVCLSSSCVLCTHCCQFLCDYCLFVFILCLVYPLLPVSVWLLFVCLHPVSCVPTVASFCVIIVCLSSSCVLCTHCCQFLCDYCLFVFILCLVYPLLPVSVWLLFVCLHPVSCVPTVASFCVIIVCLSSSCVLCTHCCQFLCDYCLFVFILCLVYPLLPVSVWLLFVCLHPVSCVPTVASFCVIIVCLSSSCVLCTHCCQFLCDYCLFVFILCLVYPLLPVSVWLLFVCLHPVSCVPTVASFCVIIVCLSSSCVLCTHCCQFLCDYCLFVFILCLVYPLLPVSVWLLFVCLHPVSCVPTVASFCVIIVCLSSSCVLCTHCCQFLCDYCLFVFILCLVYPLLPVSVWLLFVCLHPVSCVPTVASFCVIIVCLSSSCVLCTHCCQFLCDYCLFVFILCLVYPLLPVSVWLLFVCLHPVSCVPTVASFCVFVCLHPVSCVPTVASFCVIIVCLSSSCVLCTHCCQFLCDYCLFVFILCLVYPLLPVSVWLLFVCLHPVSCVPTVASFCVIIVCLSSSCVLCTHCCQFLCDYCLFVFILCLVYPLLPVSVWLLFVCLHPVSCVPTVASFCVIIVCLSSSCVLCTHCCQFLCDYCLFVFILCLVYPLLPVSVWLLFVCLHPVSCVPTVASFCVIIVCLSSSCVLCTHCCQFLCDYCLFVFILCLVYPLLPVSVWLLFVCLHPVSCVPTVASFCVIIVCLSSSCVLCTHCCQFLFDYCLFVFILCLVYPLLPVSVWLLFVCLHPVSCVPTVASFCVIIVCLSSSCVLCTHCCQFLFDYCLFVFILCLVYPLLPVSVWLLFVCLHPVSCVPTVASFCLIIVCLSSSCVLCTHCCQFLCDYCLFVFILCLVYPLLPVSVWLLFVCLHPVSCVPTVASFCVIIVCLSSSCVLCTHCCQFLFDYCLFVFILCLVYPLLPVSVWLLFVCLHPVSCVPTVASFCVIIVCLSSSCVLCTHCCQFLCDYCLFVFILCLVYPLLPVSVWLLFVCLHPVSCVPTVASFCVIIVCLSSSCVLCTHCCQFLCIFHSLLPLQIFFNIY